MLRGSEHTRSARSILATCSELTQSLPSLPSLRRITCACCVTCAASVYAAVCSDASERNHSASYRGSFNDVERNSIGSAETTDGTFIRVEGTHNTVKNNTGNSGGQRTQRGDQSFIEVISSDSSNVVPTTWRTTSASSNLATSR